MKETHNKKGYLALRAGRAILARLYLGRYLHMKLFTIFLILSVVTSAAFASDQHEQDRKKLGVTYNFEYDEGYWIKAACIYLNLSSFNIKGNYIFDNIEVMTRPENSRGQGYSFINLKTQVKGNRIYARECFSSNFIKGSYFRFMYKYKNSKGSVAHATINGKSLIEAGNKALKNAGRWPSANAF